MKIFRVDSVIVYKEPESATLTILAQGTASTPGWTDPRLDVDDPNPSDAIAEFAFDATRPKGIVTQILTPITASLVYEPQGPIDGIVVKSRTNSITVHASEFQAPPVTTARIGEELPPTTLVPGEEHIFTTYRLGEEGPTAFRGEDQPTTLSHFIEEHLPKTLMLGEEHWPTLHLGEHGGPSTSPRLEDLPDFYEKFRGFGERLSGLGPFGSY